MRFAIIALPSNLIEEPHWEGDVELPPGANAEEDILAIKWAFAGHTPTPVLHVRYDAQVAEAEEKPAPQKIRLYSVRFGADNPVVRLERSAVTKYLGSLDQVGIVYHFFVGKPA